MGEVFIEKIAALFDELLDNFICIFGFYFDSSPSNVVLPRLCTSLNELLFKFLGIEIDKPVVDGLWVDLPNVLMVATKHLKCCNNSKIAIRNMEIKNEHR